MEAGVYETMVRVERNHWWFVGRRKIVADLLRRFLPKSCRSLLDIGSGTGGNLLMLSNFGRVTAVEPNAFARECVGDLGVCDVIDASLPDLKGVPSSSYDVISLLDVLEHIEDDKEALIGVRGRLSEDGVVLATVPAYRFLYGDHDARHQHKRRYTIRQIELLFKQAGYKIVYSSYFNSLLFPVALFQRVVLEKWLEVDQGVADELPSPLVNKILLGIFSVERHLLRWMRLPFGLSVIVIARRQ